MARIKPIDPGEAPTESRAELDRQLAGGHNVTNMKRTLARSPAALTALIRDDNGFEVALKFLRLDIRSGASEQRALDVMKNVRHPHVLPTFRSWQVGTLLILALELADKNLYQRLADAEKQGHTGIPRLELLEYLLEAAKGLDYLHNLNIQHRDVKPQNLLLVGGSVKVADFGLAKLVVHSLASNSGSMTPAYAAPELIQGQVSAHADQYGLAVSCCQLRGGRLPFTGGLHEVMFGHINKRPDLSMLPENERPAVARALAKEPEKRWASCREFVDALGHSGAPNSSQDLVQATRLELNQRPEPIDCTGSDGISAAAVRRAQEEWANYLGRNVEERVEGIGEVTMTFVLIPPGKFLMGSPEDEHEDRSDETLHVVKLTEPWDLCKYEVTQVFYEALLGKNPSKFISPLHPVEQVSFDNARDFGSALTKKLDDKHIYRLPTEAEWEFACRAGRPSSHAFGIGNGRTLSSGEANFDGNAPFGDANKGPSLDKTCKVGSYHPNAFGLFDMHGNVCEWCADRYGPYPREEATNPTGPSEGSTRVVRGGSWCNLGWNCRAAYRVSLDPANRFNFLGFRLARSIPSCGI